MNDLSEVEYVNRMVFSDGWRDFVNLYRDQKQNTRFTDVVKFGKHYIVKNHPSVVFLYQHNENPGLARKRKRKKKRKKILIFLSRRFWCCLSSLQACDSQTVV